MEGVTSGAISSLKEANLKPPFVLKVTNLETNSQSECNHKCTDGVESISGTLVGVDLVSLVEAGSLKDGDLIKVIKCSITELQQERQLLITGLEVIAKDGRSAQGVGQSQGQQLGTNPKSPEARTPPQKRTSSTIGIFPENASLSPLQALNPYGTDWRIKAMVALKYGKQSFASKSGEECSRFTTHIVDEHGTKAEMTFWREAADKYFDVLEEKKVYIFSKFTVKPANRNFSTLSYDYVLNMGQRSEVHECASQDITDIKESFDATKLDQLPKYLGRQVPISVMGILVEIGSLGRVKRKSDNSELSRRDITIVDQSKKSVVITLWHPHTEQVEELDPLPETHPVVAISMCRVSDFGGLSLNTTVRSTVTLNPDTDEAKALQDWYKLEGQNERIVPLSEGLSVSRHSSGTTNYQSLSDLQPSILPPLDAKPQYGVAQATIVQIKPDQTFFYLANTENNKKVVEQDGKYYCEADGREYDNAAHRYVVNMKVMDTTGECWLSVFNDQMETILGMSADELVALRSSDEAAFRETVANAQWQPHIFRIAGRSRQDVNTGELRMRHTVVALHNFSWTNACKTALDAIKRLA